MTDISISDITFFLELAGISFVVLSILLIIVKVALFILRRLARHHVARTDLDMIGVQAVVTHTIRPRRPGKIRCVTDDGELVTEATSENMIRSGQTVMITAIKQGSFCVLPYDPDAQAGSAELPGAAGSGES